MLEVTLSYRLEVLLFHQLAGQHVGVGDLCGSQAGGEGSGL